MAGPTWGPKMKNQIKALKVKVKSLAAEATIIRLEERRSLAGKRRDEQLYASLRQHRVTDVRKEQRSALLAYAFLRGMDYRQVEPKAVKVIDTTRVKQLVEKFGSVGWPPYKCEAKVLADWFAGTLAVHPFAKKQAA